MNDNRLPRLATLFLLLFAVLLLLIAPWATRGEMAAPAQDAAAAAAIALLCALAFAAMFTDRPTMIFSPRRWFWFLLYLPVFAAACLKANLDVAYRVLHPEVPIRPGIVRVKTTLKTDLARALLANSITLTPGTLTVDIQGDTLYVHWIYVYDDDPGPATEMIVRRFERLLQKVFE